MDSPIHLVVWSVDWQNQRECFRADEEKKQMVPRKNNYRRRLRQWHSDTGKYTRPSWNNWYVKDMNCSTKINDAEFHAFDP